jgi:flagellar biosynthesis protein FlhA
MKPFLELILKGRGELALVFAMIFILAILFVPIPAGLLDLLLIVNFSMAMLVLLITFLTESPLSFSTFPSLLLIATLFRLALNVSATRLILNGGNAGHVIAAIGSYVVGGNYVIGLVVFLILVVVQYVVVTSGAQRVAEVAARFTLDSMPGKQMSIDADMNMGLIDQDEARRRRAMIEREANFYGAMDGATKFVKGDAVAGIIILLIDIVGGLSIGMLQHGMPWTDAVHRYTLLTVGDGIVTQIPALIIATATGIIITRAASDAQLGGEIARQVLGNPRTLMVVAVALAVLLFMPGLPMLPVGLVLAGVAALIWVARRGTAEAEETPVETLPAAAAGDEDSFYDAMRIQSLELRLGVGLLDGYRARATELTERAGVASPVRARLRLCPSIGARARFVRRGRRAVPGVSGGGPHCLRRTPFWRGPRHQPWRPACKARRQRNPRPGLWPARAVDSRRVTRLRAQCWIHPGRCRHGPDYPPDRADEAPCRGAADAGRDGAAGHPGQGSPVVPGR